MCFKRGIATDDIHMSERVGGRGGPSSFDPIAVREKERQTERERERERERYRKREGARWRK